jgi:hypothetical protein
MRRTLVKTEALQLLEGLDLPRDDFAISGSGAVMARGFIDRIADIDIIARGEAWERACRLRKPEPAPRDRVERILLFDGRVEILNGWFPSELEAQGVDAGLNKLIDEAELICGYRCVRLSVIIATMRLLNRPRDQEHLVAIERGNDRHF